MQIYLDERERESGSGQPAPKVSWRHYYASMQHAFCIEGPSPEEHSLLLQIAKASALRQGATSAAPHTTAVRTASLQQVRV